MGTSSNQSVGIDLDALEREDSLDAFPVTLGGRSYVLRRPTDLPWGELLSIRADASILQQVAEPDEREDFAAAITKTPAWKVNKLAEAYLKHMGLPSLGEAPASRT